MSVKVANQRSMVVKRCVHLLLDAWLFLLYVSMSASVGHDAPLLCVDSKCGHTECASMRINIGGTKQLGQQQVH